MGKGIAFIDALCSEEIGDECSKCSGKMDINYSTTYTSVPPKYKATCGNCGHTEFIAQWLTGASEAGVK